MTHYETLEERAARLAGLKAVYQRAVDAGILPTGQAHTRARNRIEYYRDCLRHAQRQRDACDRRAVEIVRTLNTLMASR